jgi:hypothetical protein
MKRIELSEEDRRIIKVFVNNARGGKLLTRRARVILDLDEMARNKELTIAEICERNGISRQGICDIRKAFLKADSASEILSRKARAIPPNQKLTGESEARIIALACSEPPKGYARWTLRLLRDRCIELEIMDEISHNTIKLLLKKRNLSLI